MGVICILLRPLFRRPQHGAWQTFFTIAVSALLGAALIECVQPWFGRTASLEDLGWGAIGALGGSLWVGTRTSQAPSLASALAMIIMLAPPAAWLGKAGMAVQAADASFPELLGVPGNQGRFFWSVLPSETHTHRSLEEGISLQNDGKQAASARLEVLGRDWSEFAGLEIHGHLEANSTVEIGVRLDLDDEGKTRVRAGGRMNPGPNQLRIRWPRDQPPHRVGQLVIFLPPDAPLAKLHLERVRLIRPGD